MLYQAYLAHSDMLLPVRSLAGVAMRAIGQPLAGLTDNAVLRNLTAVYELVARAGLTHDRPPYRIDSTRVGNREVAVTEEAADVTPFGTLLHFKKDVDAAQPRVLLVAPMSGHFATCCDRRCARCCPSTTSTSPTGTMCATSPSSHGRFGFNSYIEHLIRFLEKIGPGAHVVAVCQPCVAVLADDRGDGAERQSGTAAQHDADGRTDRHAGQPDQGQRTRQLETDRVVRAEPDRDRAAALPRRACAGSIRASSSSPRS